MNNRELGAIHEEAACEYLSSLGMHIIARNFRTKTGEIDLIAKDGDTLVFVEVKFRRTARAGDALSAIDSRKQCRIRHVARQYLHYAGLNEDIKMRFDCIGITDSDFRYVMDAF